MEKSDSLNLLPCDGEVLYFKHGFTSAEAAIHFESLLNSIEWKQDEIWMFGRTIVTKRKVAWYGSSPFSYTYSKTTKKALLFTRELLEIKQVTELVTGESYNACLLNLYNAGEEGMGWHSDNENTIVADSAIASVSFGASRKFSFRHKQTKETISLQLEGGSILLMRGQTQSNWQHASLTSKRVRQPRINLTFRKMIVPI
ncbi:MAG: alpha-ketoglutarate-dependent dioxygenase AlkB [Bacteroidota bacterium]